MCRGLITETVERVEHLPACAAFNMAACHDEMCGAHPEHGTAMSALRQHAPTSLRRLPARKAHSSRRRGGSSSNQGA